jgi:hypothetical protein
MGLKPSPFMAIRFYYLAEEFARGNCRHNCNELRWDVEKMNLPGDPAYDPTQPGVMKWDNLIKIIAGDIVDLLTINEHRGTRSKTLGPFQDRQGQGFNI